MPTVLWPSRAWAASNPPIRRALVPAACRSWYGDQWGIPWASQVREIAWAKLSTRNWGPGAFFGRPFARFN